jgi:type VI secretion system protein ImpA
MLLADLSEASPAGANLELDIEFGALERAAQGKPETQYGDIINPAVPPDWRETEAIALRLLERTRDLRVLTHLAVSRLHLSGIAGFAAVLGQIREQVQDRWREVHPQLDQDDGDDTTLRANALLRLQDPPNVLRTLRDLPLADSPRTGPITWRDVAVFNGTAEPEPGREKPTEAFLLGGFRDTDPDRLAGVRDAISQALQEIVAISGAFEAQAGLGTGPDLGNLKRLLGELAAIVQRFSAAAPVAEPMQDVGATPPEDARAVKSIAARAVKSIAAVSSREEALYCLDLAAAYFRTHEPSSPVPMLISRAQRLAVMDFLDIVRDLAPDGLAQAQLVAGSPPE